MKKIVFLDTETTGLSDNCELWEIALILREDDAPDAEYVWQLRPTMEFAEPTGLRISRYYERAMLADLETGMALKVVDPTEFDHPEITAYSPSAYERVTVAKRVAGQLAALLDGATLVGAVPWFDERHLKRFLTRHDETLTSHYHLVDVETLAAGSLGQAPPWGFDSLLASFGLSYAEADRHTALGDARMVRDLYDRVLGVAKPDGTDVQ